MNVTHRLTRPAAVAIAAALVVCSPAVVVRVVDLDNGSTPIAGATIERYPVPHHRGDPFAPTPVETRQTDADGKAVFAADSGRLIVRAPGKASASIFSTFLPHTIDVGVSAAPAAK